MRGGRVGVAALCLSLLACASPPPPAAAPTSPAPTVQKRPEGLPPESAARFVVPPPPVEPERAPGGGAAKEPEPPRPEVSLAELVKMQRELAAKPGAGDEERLRLALLLASSGELEEAERITSSMKSPGGKLAPYLELFLKRQLGEHKEASKALASLLEEERKAVGFVIERAELCSRVRRFRDYAVADSERVAPGGVALLYIEPRNFSTRVDGERHTLHLRYEWKLFDDRSVEVPVPAWDGADEAQKEDRLSTLGPVREFYQSFRLPLPANLAAGPYRIKVSVTDVVAGKSDRVYVPIVVGAVER